EPRSVARAIPRVLGVVPGNRAAEVGAGRRHYMELPGGVSIGGDGVTSGVDDPAVAGLQICDRRGVETGDAVAHEVSGDPCVVLDHAPEGPGAADAPRVERRGVRVLDAGYPVGDDPGRRGPVAQTPLVEPGGDPGPFGERGLSDVRDPVRRREVLRRPPVLERLDFEVLVGPALQLAPAPGCRFRLAGVVGLADEDHPRLPALRPRSDRADRLTGTDVHPGRRR